MRRAVSHAVRISSRQFLMEEAFCNACIGGTLGVADRLPGARSRLRQFTNTRGRARRGSPRWASYSAPVIGMFFGIYPAVKGVEARPGYGAAHECVQDDAPRSSRENLLVALDTLRSRKIRSALTILGIVIGVTGVISVAAIIDGLNGYIQSRIQSFGSRSVLHHAHSAGVAPVSRRCRRRCGCASISTHPTRSISRKRCDGLGVASAFAYRIDLGNQKDTISYGNEQVQRTDSAWHAARLRRGPAALHRRRRPLRFSFRRPARAQCSGNRTGHRRFAFPAQRPHRQGGASQRTALRSNRRFRQRPRSLWRLRRGSIRLHSHVELP